MSLFLFNFPLSFFSVFGNQLDDFAVLFSKEIGRLKTLALDHLLALFVDLLVSQVFHSYFRWYILKSSHFKWHFSVLKIREANLP